MRKSAFTKCAFAIAFAMPIPIGTAACGAPLLEHEEASAGSLSMPLVTAVNGHRYRLTNAAVNVVGPTYVWLQSSDDPEETRLTATLQTGFYSASLIQWTLERDDGTGTFYPVRAQLLSATTVSFDVFADTTTSISYRFETDGDIVVIGSGELRVSVSVNEVAPACAPLGADRSAGTWCPPSALTGRPSMEASTPGSAERTDAMGSLEVYLS